MGVGVGVGAETDTHFFDALVPEVGPGVWVWVEMRILTLLTPWYLN